MSVRFVSVSTLALIQLAPTPEAWQGGDEAKSSLWVKVLRKFERPWVSLFVGFRKSG